MTLKDDFIAVNNTIKLISNTDDITIYKDGNLLKKYKRTNPFVNDKIKKINENFKVNNTTVRLIELTSGIVIQIGKYGLSIYKSMTEFLTKTSKSSYLGARNFFLIF